MYFKFFQLGVDVEKRISKAGFLVNSYEEISSFSGEAKDFAIQVPRDYQFKGNLWRKIEMPGIYEQYCLLAKTPYLPFDELWNLLLTAKKEEDRTGALVFMYKQHYRQLREKYKFLSEMREKFTKSEERAFRSLSCLM